VTEGKLPTRIVHISDLHCPAKNPAQPEALIASIRAAAPDIVAVTGDLTRRARRREFVNASELLAALPGAKLVVPGTETCTLEGTTYTQTSTAYNEASWSSSKQFEAQTILTGTLKVATTGSGEFVNITLKK